MVSKSASGPAAIHSRLVAYAMQLPGAYEDHPWGESVAKVGRKVFAFFGTDDSATDFGMGVKLPASQPLALAQPGVTPMAYGLGKASWVSVRFGDAAGALPYEMLRLWVEESYRAVAPKKLVALLSAHGAVSNA